MYRDDIDGLRAIAVLTVMLFHAGLGFPGGYIGVDVFFVISGFLVTGIIRRELDAQTFSMLVFWRRRISRILPAALFMTICVLVAGYFLLFSDEFKLTSESVISHQLMSSNIFFWRHSGYFSNVADMQPLLHTWSLSVEEQFYLIMPLTLVAVHAAKQLRIKWVIASAMAVSLLLSIHCTEHHRSANFFLLPTRAWELLAGSLVCGLTITGRSTFLSETLRLLGIAFILVPCFIYNSKTNFPGIAAVPVVVGAVLILVPGKATLVSRILSSRVLATIGLASYSLYLWHWPILVFLRHLFGESLDVEFRLGAFFASFPAGFISWKYVESPFRRGRSTSLPQARLKVILISWATIFLLGLAVILLNGMPDRLDPRAEKYASAADSLSFKHDITLEQAESEQLPQFGEVKSDYRCLIWGDSHAIALVAGLDSASHDVGVMGYQATCSSTAPLLGFVYEAVFGLGKKNPDFAREILSFVKKHRIKTVFLAACWWAYTDDPAFEPCLRKTVDSLNDLDCNIVLVLDVAQQNENIPMALSRAVRLGRDVEAIGLPRREHELRNRDFNAIASRLESEGLCSLLDPGEILVDSVGIWRAEIDGISIYRDDDHLSTEGSLLLAPLFKEALRNSIGIVGSD